MTSTDPLTKVSTRATPQSEQAHRDQVPNSAGGWAWQADDWARLDRFLILGVEGGTYYLGERDLTKQNAEVVLRLARTDGERLVARIVEVSEGGLAHKQNPTLLALAAACGSEDPATRRAACDALARVCRTGTHLFVFARYVEQFRGWGRGLRRAVAAWYADRPAESLALHLVKYRQREGWSHRDLLRLSHAATADPARRTAFEFACGRLTEPPGRDGLDPIEGYMLVNADGVTAREAAGLVEAYRLPWEALPDRLLAEPAVWEALLPTLGQTALIRQLGRLSAIGLIAPMSDAANLAAGLIADADRLKAGRVHPMAVLLALSTYAAGRGVLGKLSWTASPEVIDALDAAFYLAFGAVEPTGKRTLLALDVSGSMTQAVGGTHLSCRAASAAMAMVTAATEPQWAAMGFSHALVPLSISPRQRLDDAVATISNLPFGGTDCALPMLWAEQNSVEVETFVVYTDNETWAGSVHPFQALRRYRERTGIPAKFAVVAMASNGFSIANPNDVGMLDMVGLDASTPAALSAFSRA